MPYLFRLGSMSGVFVSARLEPVSPPSITLPFHAPHANKRFQMFAWVELNALLYQTLVLEPVWVLRWRV